MSTNDITGDKLQSKTATDAYRDGWEKIFGKKDKNRIEVECKVIDGRYESAHEALARENTACTK